TASHCSLFPCFVSDSRAGVPSILTTRARNQRSHERGGCTPFSSSCCQHVARIALSTTRRPRRTRPRRPAGARRRKIAATGERYARAALAGALMPRRARPQRESAARQAVPGWSRTCEELAAVLRNWPVREIERDVRLRSPQRVALDEL